MVTVPKNDTALLVIDMQRAFFDESCSLGQLGADVAPLRAAIPGCVKLVTAARAAQVPVIFTRYVYLPGMADFAARRDERAKARIAVNSLGADTQEIEIIPELAPLPHEVVIDKARPSAFYATRLEPVLTGQGIRNLVICGVTTNICVEGTARDAGQRDYGTYVVRDAVAEFSPERNHYSLVTIDWMFGEVVTLYDVETGWAG
ncbi:cysteine hydrolase [Breoghania sp.]|uniref:cysteine hydrolase family protein n=1 Tax=Breoghania sp. TaxID=2065378 RepID=UPI002AA7D584|nr:cysteine hydrolase [Breoghania sp.]